MPFETSGGEEPILCHNMPFDIYSTKYSCGPDVKTCLTYDFRSVHGEYNEYTLNSVPISKYNVREKARVLVEQVPFPSITSTRDQRLDGWNISQLVVDY